MRAFLRRTIRASALVAKDPEVPRPLRAAAGIGLLPIPGPLDEVVLILVAAVLWILYRVRLRSAWERAGEAAAPQAQS